MACNREVVNQIAAMTSSMSVHRDHRAEHHSAALETARRADTEERPHPETEIERARMNEQSFEHVLVPAHVRSSEPAGLVQMRTRSLEQFAASAE
jgi:hypothetical protein